MSPTDPKTLIRETLLGFAKKNLTEAGLNLFQILGFNTQRTAAFASKTPDYFINAYAQASGRFDAEKALTTEWKYVDLLFQLTREEISPQLSMFDTGRVDNTIIESYLFFVIELNQAEYTRTALSRMTREINKVFPMPVMVLFKHGETLSLAVIDRRLHKRDEQKDVLEKVTFIKDIRISMPHRAHVEILFDLSFGELLKKHGFRNFVELHKAWRATLDINSLNKRFYRELSDWYFWAIKEVSFPGADIDAYHMGLFTQEERVREHNAKNLIRLLSRLLFVWFIKEKNLVPDDFFKSEVVYGQLLNEEAKKQTGSYYKAILQNLFFACLNQSMGKREFRKEGQHRNTTTLMRYQKLFSNPENFVQTVESIVPFMNGGLFDCLDKPDPDKKGRLGGDVIIYQDGFSDRDDNNLKVPDHIFFGTRLHVDLSDDYGDKARKDTTVKGLIDILKAYKFTIAENTPLEEEVALDPELLGKVFENLLASYNPETRTTARNKTGSFYTPREIVDYMVNESIKAYLAQALKEKLGIAEEDGQAGLDLLLMYTEKEHPFTHQERDVLVEAIDHFKIIDPACGSGAFPMGILHKLVYILHKLDPGNQLWKQRQIGKAMQIDDGDIRERLLEDIEESFANNEMDYGRKLYLIEQCIYGTDIQPIAVQISKLRFFISLIVDQKVNPAKENLGVRPLPNLETKFVTADSLVTLEKPQQQLSLFDTDKIQALMKSIKDARHRIFSLKDPGTKRKWREKDKELREQLCVYLIEEGWTSETAQTLANWDPYDQNASAPFFDAEWMFGINEGFDVVIGNPPYIQIQSFSGKPEQIRWESQRYKTYTKTGDVYCLFYEKGFQLLNGKGLLCYITSNKWMRAGYGKTMRKFFVENGSLHKLIDFGDSPIFENATTYTNIALWNKTKENISTQAWDLSKAYEATTELTTMLEKQGLGEALFTEDSFVISGKDHAQIKTRIEKAGTPLKDWDIVINRGILTGFNEAFIIDADKRDELVAADPKNSEILKPILRGRDIKRYKAEWAGLWLVATHNGYREEGGKQVPPINVEKDYPVIYAYLDKIGHDVETGKVKAKGKGLYRRDDQGSHWSNLRDCAYYNDFSKEKIIWAEMVYDSAFLFDNKGYYINDTCFIMVGKNLKYLLSLINSRLLTYSYKAFYAGGDLRGDTFRYKKVFLEQLPILQISASAQAPYEALTDIILFAKAWDMVVEVKALEWLIDVMVFGLYFEDEMKAAECYINDRVAEVVKPFKPDDTDEFKTTYIQKLVTFCESDSRLRHGLVHCRTVEPIKIVLEAAQPKENKKKVAKAKK